MDSERLKLGVRVLQAIYDRQQFLVVDRVGALGRCMADLTVVATAAGSSRAVVVDAGYHPGGVGDIELRAITARASAYTPVPGGVGPMTINTLILQTLEAAETAALGTP